MNSLSKNTFLRFSLEFIIGGLSIFLAAKTDFYFDDRAFRLVHFPDFQSWLIPALIIFIGITCAICVAWNGLNDKGLSPRMFRIGCLASFIWGILFSSAIWFGVRGYAL